MGSLLLIASCANSATNSQVTVSQDDAGAAAALRAAAQRTFAADSFRFVGSDQLGNHKESWTGAYVSPDRVQLTGAGANGSTTIVIGGDEYMSDPCPPFPPVTIACDPGAFMKVTVPGMSAQAYLIPLDLLTKIKSARVVGDTYVFSLGSGATAASGTATVANGLIVDVVFHFSSPGLGPVQQRMELSEFGAHVLIEPPPPGRVRKLTQIPSCGPQTPLPTPGQDGFISFCNQLSAAAVSP